jgi:hypothetical protein
MLPLHCLPTRVRLLDGVASLVEFREGERAWDGRVYAP